EYSRLVLSEEELIAIDGHRVARDVHCRGNESRGGAEVAWIGQRRGPIRRVALRQIALEGCSVETCQAEGGWIRYVGSCVRQLRGREDQPLEALPEGLARRSQDHLIEKAETVAVV